MNKKIYFLSLFFILLVVRTQAQWTVPPCPVPGLTFHEAPLLDCCLDGYTYQTDVIPNMVDPPGFCGTGENAQWLAFRATFTGIVFQFDVSNCQGAQQPTGGGLQMQVYNIGAFCDDNLLFPIGDCFSPDVPISGQVSAMGLIPGHVYYIFIDGWSGDVCDYTISILETIDDVPIDSPTLTGPTAVVSGQSATYSLEFPNLDNHNPCGNFKQDNVPCSCIDPNPANITWTGPPDAIIQPIPNTFSAIITFGNTSGEVCINVNTFCGNFSDCLFVEVENLCADAGEDQYLCGFEAQLNGSPTPGTWNFLCDISDGKVEFSGNQDTTNITVSNCGNYYFEYISDDPNCMDTDTVLISLEDPSTRNIEVEADANIYYKDLECHEPGEVEPCENQMTIPGIPPPEVEWEFCANGVCNSIIYSTEVFNDDGCLADSIHISSDTNSGAFSLCNQYGQDDVLVNFWDILDGIVGSAAAGTGCPAANQCFSPKIIDTVIYERSILLPKREGGNWYIILPTEIIMADVQNFFSYQNHDFILYLSPSGDYYGPGDIDLELFEITSQGDTIYQSIQVDFQMQWIEEWSFVEVTDIDTVYIYEDDLYNCGGNSLTFSGFDMSGIPDYPCDPIDVSFPPYDCELCPVDIIIDAEPEYSILDCCNPCVTLSGSGSSSEGNVSVRWENGLSTMTVCQGGSYTLTVTSLPSGCTKQETVSVDEDFQFPSVFIPNPDPITCLNPCVTLESVVSGNASQYGYQWSGPNNFFSFEPSPTVCEPGNYQLIVFDFWNCCEAWADVNVIENISTETIDIEAIICPDECYDLNGQTYCSAGVYSQNGFDQDGCPTVTNLTLDVYESSSSEIQMTLCEDEHYLFEPTGNIYDFANPTGTETIQNANGCDSLVNIQLDFFTPENEFETVELCEGDCYQNGGTTLCQAGIYPINIQDDNGCEAILEVEIISYPQKTTNLNFNLCESEFMEINGTIYDNSNPTGTEILQTAQGCDSLVIVEINSIPSEYLILAETVCEGECIELNGETFCTPGVYFQTIQGTNGCEATVEFSLSNHQANASDFEADLCQGEFIEINGTIYDENNSVGTEIFQDINGCDSLVDIQINTIPTEYQVLNEVICEGGCYDLNGETFCDEGVYYQSYVGSFGCEGFIELNLSKHPQQTSNLNFELCENELVEVNGTIYDINNPSGIEVFSDINGCDSLVFVQVNTLPNEVISSNAELCEGNCIDFFGQLICDPGFYTFTEIASNGCETIHELSVESLPSFSSTISESLCDGDQIIVNGTIYDVSNSFGQEIFTAQNGCDSIVTVDLNFVSISIDIIPPSTINCIDTVVEIIGDVESSEPVASSLWLTSNGNILSNPNSLSIQVDEAGLYFFEVVTMSGCIESKAINVSADLTPPVPVVIPTVKINCNTNEAQLTCENSNFIYEWAGPGINDENRFEQNPIISLSGDYELILTDPTNGCSEVAQVFVAEPDFITFETSTSPSCANSATGKIELLSIEGGQEPYVYFVNGVQVSDLNVGFDSGNYNVEILDANGCSSIQNIDVLERPTLEILNENIIEICGIQEVTLEPIVNFPNEVLNYKWEDGSSISTRVISREGLYTLTIQNECDVVSHEFEVIDNEFSIRNKIYVPNAFSPNGDAVNDEFQAYVGVDLTEFELMVFDRWGNLVFETTDPSGSWNGQNLSDKIDSAVFVWMLHAKGFGCDDQIQEIILRGDVVLMR